jgi:EAL and modified HD-GYP domain-containing signal transduction protein
MQDVFLGRQPILDRDLKVYAYELLYRNSFVNRAIIDDFDAASSEVVANVLLEIGLDNIVGPHIAFCNFTRNFLVQNTDFSFAASRLVIEVLEDVEADDEVIAALREYSARGHIIALDDFEYSEKLRPLVEIAQIIKIDVMQLGQQKSAELAKQLQAINPELKFLAEKVETSDEFDFFMAQGFDYFQGYFFSKPKIVTGKKLPPARLTMLQLATELQNPDASLDRIEEIISSDVYLSVKLLRQVNSSYYSFVSEVTSIRQAIVRLGLQHVRDLACVLVLSSVSDKVDELTTMALIRGKMCEMISEKLDLEDQTSFFTVGMFSMLDSILETPMEEIVAQLPLAQEINNALLGGESKYADILRVAREHKLDTWDTAQEIGLQLDGVVEIYWEAVNWTDQLKSSIN